MITITAEKAQLRQTMLEQRNNMTRKERDGFSQNLCEQLWVLISGNKIKILHSYLPMGPEVNVLPLLQKALNSGITVVVPRSLRKRQMQNLIVKDLKTMEAGIFNTYHPKDAMEYSGGYELIIVPGLAFDKSGFRVGYGAGYYDTFLAEQPTALKVGVCYPFQLMERVPVEDHDVWLDLVLN
ncbi:MAG: 5-formyltetrahydrofolate cyclo-ligase [Saprospiraceae bacterium]